MRLPNLLCHLALLPLCAAMTTGCLSDDVTPPRLPPPAPDCSAETPVCSDACGGGEVCAFAAGVCACIAACDSSAPQCAGTGPNAGCGVDELCNTSCACEPIGCVPDAPQCEGDGPNAGCDEGQRCNAACACVPDAPPVPPGLLPRPSHSGPVVISADDAVVAMVNTDDGSLSVFDATTQTRQSITPTSDTAKSEPFAVVLSPDGDTAYVANRTAGTIARITGIRSAQPALAGELESGGEPVGVALSPTGATLWVTDWVAGTVAAIDTASFTVRRTVDVGGNPYAIAVTNDGDTEDSDELILVTQFYGRPRGEEASDTGRDGVVHVIPAGADAPSEEILLAPKEDCFTATVNELPTTTACFPNQLHHITVHTAFGRTRAYVSSVAASPEGPVNFNLNVQALVSVIDVEALREEPARTVNLNALVRDQVDNDGDERTGRRFMNMLNGLAFVTGDDRIIGYATAGGSDIVLRVVWDEAGQVSVGSPSALNIPVGQSPQGLTIKHGSIDTGAYVANLISRDMSFALFRDQLVTDTITSTERPTPGTSEFEVWQGKRFFNTATGIWSKEGWGSCQGCHPNGLSDSVTWSFAAGPRQTIALDGQYASSNPRDMRALNWTAIFDETADFELNTRGVSGGIGTLQDLMGPLVGVGGVAPFGGLLMEDGATRENHQALNGSLSFVASSLSVCTNRNTCPDFGLIDRYIQSLPSPRGKRDEADKIAQGRALFQEGGCAKCHGGEKWTISRVFYDPTAFVGSLPARTFAANAAASAPMDPSTLVGVGIDANVDTTLIAGDDSEGGTPAFKRLACNVRRVGTFGALGGAAEVRANGTQAQGSRGFNPPSLLGLATGAPYLHNGAAVDLNDLFDSRFSAHTLAGNPNLILNNSEREALVAFLMSIDETTETFPIPAGATLCPDQFTP